MEINTFDILLLFILAITVALIIGMNVIYIVDKKMSDIRINVPPCPTPNVYIKSQNGIFSKIDVDNVDRNTIINLANVKNTTKIANQDKLHLNQLTDQRTKQIKSNPNIVQNNSLIRLPGGNTINKHTMNRRSNDQDQTDLIDSNKRIEGFGTMEKSDEMPNAIPLVINQGHDKETVILKQGYNSSGADKPNIGDDITYPDGNDIVRYNGPGCYENLDTKQIRRVNINRTRGPICRATLREGSVNNIKSGFMTAGGDIINQNIDFYVPRTYLGNDPFIDGTSYAQLTIESPADIDQIGSIPVNDYDGEPVPIESYAGND
jgi:hypothetical protein